MKILVSLIFIAFSMAVFAIAGQGAINLSQDECINRVGCPLTYDYSDVDPELMERLDVLAQYKIPVSPFSPVPSPEEITEEYVEAREEEARVELLWQEAEFSFNPSYLKRIKNEGIFIENDQAEIRRLKNAIESFDLSYMFNNIKTISKYNDGHIKVFLKVYLNTIKYNDEKYRVYQNLRISNYMQEECTEPSVLFCQDKIYRMVIEEVKTQLVQEDLPPHIGGISSAGGDSRTANEDLEIEAGQLDSLIFIQNEIDDIKLNELIFEEQADTLKLRKFNNSNISAR